MIIIIVFVITSVFHLARIWRFLMKNFNTFLSLAGSLLTFVPFTSLLIISFHVFLDFPLAKLPITLKVLHLISNKTFSSIKVFFSLNLHPCYSIFNLIASVELLSLSLTLHVHLTILAPFLPNLITCASLTGQVPYNNILNIICLLIQRAYLYWLSKAINLQTYWIYSCSL